MLQQQAAPRSLALDYAVGICGVWISGGFFLDAWAHGHVPVESFFTPYHGVFYTGMLALVLVLVSFAVQNHRLGYSWPNVFPRPYRLALLGIPIFVLGGLGDMLWHRLLGIEEGVDQIGGSCIIAPSGEVVAACTTKGDEIALARCDLDLCNSYKRTIFNFDIHRQPRAYRMIVERKGQNLMADGTPVGSGK